MSDPTAPPADAGESGRTVAPTGRSSRITIGSLSIVIVICFQVGIPLTALLQPPPQKFGFQMYSGLGGVTAVMIDASGSEHRIDDVERLVAKIRPEIDWLPSLPGAICEAEPSAVSVRVEQSGDVRTIECD